MSNTELIQRVIGSLGVDEKTAEGALGLIFRIAQTKLGEDEFEKISEMVPNINSLIGSAPSASSASVGSDSMMDFMTQALGSMGAGDNAQGSHALAELAQGFSELGLGIDSLSSLAQELFSFFQARGDAQVGLLLGKVLH